MKKMKFNIKKTVIYTAGAFFLFGFVMFGPINLLEKTSTPEFCKTCHVLKPQYTAWLKGGRHRSVRCVDCHLPNNNIVNHVIWKGIDGMKDVFLFYTRIYKDQLSLSDHGKASVQKNCIRCHKTMVSSMSTTGRNCWSCHRSVKHRFPGRRGL